MTATEIDTQALRAKYLEERDKRLRDDGNEQYINVADLPEYLDDPHGSVPEREPRFDEIDIAFIGGGFAGLVTGAKLREAGLDVTIIEKGSDVGGTWYWNRYPGAQCDTTSFVYMPLLEETGHMPTEKYAHGPEILEHSQRIAQHYGLYDQAILGTEVTELRWDDDAGRWLIRTDRGDELRARHVAMGTGPLHRPKLPGLEGIDDYRGISFHTSRWDYDKTGGDRFGAPMTGLADKRVGIVGTGATSVQVVPNLARDAGELFVFQRTPSSIDVRNNAPTDPDWFMTLGEGWQQRWLENFTTLQTGGFTDEDLTMDGWTDLSKRIRDRIVEEVMANPEEFDGVEPTPELRERAYHASDDEKMTEIRQRVDEVVRDPETADALKPWYRQLCKRPCFHDQYLDAYNRPNVTLVDTDGQGVERITEKGLVANGEEYELDVIIYASGFEVGTDYARRSGYETYGRDGVSLTEAWDGGMRTMHGIHVHGFPNLYIVAPAQGANLISNVPHNFVEAGATIAAILRHAADTGATRVEVTAEAEQAWLEVLGSGRASLLNSVDCTPGYYNNEGMLYDETSNFAGLGHPDGPMAYFEYIQGWRSDGEFAGLTFAPVT